MLRSLVGSEMCIRDSTKTESLYDDGHSFTLCVVGVGRVQRRSGTVRAVAVRTRPKPSAQSRHAKVLGWSAPNSDEHFSSSARQISPKFSRSLGEGAPCRGAKKFQNLTRDFPVNRGQSTPRSKISTPHISPKWGTIPPKQNLYLPGSLGLQCSVAS